MALNHLVKKSAVERYGKIEGTEAEIKAAIARDEKGFDEAGVEEIYAAIAALKGEQPSAEQSPSAPKTQGEALGLDRFDFHNLINEDFRGGAYSDYTAFVESLQKREQFDFELYKANTIKRDRYPGLPNTPIDVVGVKIIDYGRPINTTRIEARHALELNSQVDNSGRYYLLKK